MKIMNLDENKKMKINKIFEIFLDSEYYLFKFRELKIIDLTYNTNKNINYEDNKEVILNIQECDSSIHNILENSNNKTNSHLSIIFDTNKDSKDNSICPFLNNSKYSII